MADLNRPLVGHPASYVPMAVKCAVAVVGIICTSAIAEKLLESLLSDTYGDNEEKFIFSLLPVFFTLLLTATGSACILILTNGPWKPSSAIHAYCGASVSGIISNWCRHGGLIYASSTVGTLFGCSAMLPDMIWGGILRQRVFTRLDYLFAVLVSVGSSIFIIFPVTTEETTHTGGREQALWGVFLWTLYLGLGSFKTTYQEVLFQAHGMTIFNQLMYISLISCVLSLGGLVLQSHFVSAILFMVNYPRSFLDIFLLSCIGMVRQFFIFYTIKSFGARTLALILSVRRVGSIFASYIWYTQPLSWLQWLGSAIIVTGIILDNIYGSPEDDEVEAESA